MKTRGIILCLSLVLTLCLLWWFKAPGPLAVSDQATLPSEGQPDRSSDSHPLKAGQLAARASTADASDLRSSGLKGFQNSLDYLIHTEGLVREIPESQSNVRREAKALGRVLFLDDWAVLRLRYPKLPKSLGETLYMSVMESARTSNKIDVVDWISRHLREVSLEEVLQSQSADASVAMSRHYQRILEGGQRPELMEVVRALGGEFDASTLMGAPMLMDLWAYGFLRVVAEEWEKQILRTRLPSNIERTPEERALFHQSSPGLIQNAAEERRWFQWLHRRVFAWRLGQLHGVKDPAQILEIVDKIQLKDAHHFGWPEP